MQQRFTLLHNDLLKKTQPIRAQLLGLLKLRVARKEDLFFLSITFRELRKETLNLRKEKLSQSSSDARSIYKPIVLHFSDQTDLQ